MSIGETVARRSERACRPRSVGRAARAVAGPRRGDIAPRRRALDPRKAGRRQATPLGRRVAATREFDDAELDPAFDEFGNLADHIDGLALRVRGFLPRCGHDEPGTDHD